MKSTNIKSIFSYRKNHIIEQKRHTSLRTLINISLIRSSWKKKLTLQIK